MARTLLDETKRRSRIVPEEMETPGISPMAETLLKAEMREVPPEVLPEEIKPSVIMTGDFAPMLSGKAIGDVVKMTIAATITDVTENDFTMDINSADEVVEEPIDEVVEEPMPKEKGGGAIGMLVSELKKPVGSPKEAK